MWINRFKQYCNFFFHATIGKLTVLPAKRELIDCQGAFHIGQLSRDLKYVLIREGYIYSADESHSVIHFHNIHTLAKNSEMEIKYAAVVNGDNGMTIMVTLDGVREGLMAVPLMMF